MGGRPHPTDRPRRPPIIRALPSEELLPPSLPASHPSILPSSIVLGCQGRYAASHSSSYLPSICHKIGPRRRRTRTPTTDAQTFLLSPLPRCTDALSPSEESYNSASLPGAKSTYPYRKNDHRMRGAHHHPRNGSSSYTATHESYILPHSQVTGRII